MKEVFERVKKSWNIIKIVSCLVMIVLTFFFGYTSLNKMFRNPEANYGDEFHNMPEDSVDIIVLGSSHAQYSFVPSFVYQNTGLYSYVLGTPCQPLKVSYQMLREALKTQDPELVVLEVYTATPLKEACDGDACYVTAQYQMRDEEKYNTINFLSKEKAESYRNEFINNHNNWRTMTFDEVENESNEETISYDFGYVYMSMDFPPANVWKPMIYSENVDVELEKEDIDALNDICNICEEKDIDLLLYMTPMDNIDIENQSYRYKVWEWAREKEINYIDFVDLSDELGLWMQIHSDGFHSTIAGASIITDYLSDYISKNFEFISHENNDLLNEAYSKSICNNAIGVMSSELNPNKYFKRFVNYPGTVVIRYNSSNGRLNDNMKVLLKSAGCEDEMYSGNSYFAIIKNGEVIESSDTYLDTYIDDHHIEVLYNKISIDFEAIDESSCFSIVAFNQTYTANSLKRINLQTNWEVGYSKYYQPMN